MEPILVVSVEGEGKVEDLNKDIDRLYEYLYTKNLQDKISGPTIGLFFTETGGRYIATVPILFPIREIYNLTHDGGYEIEIQLPVEL